MRRLRRSPREQPLTLNNGTPKKVQELFFKDGTLLLARNVKQGSLTSNDTWGCYGWFAFLVFSSFPLTPLIIPLIDKQRNGEENKTSDYVPSSYRPERLEALARLRKIQGYGTTTPFDVLQSLGSTNATDRPPPEMLLKAILKAEQDNIKQDKSFFLEALAGVPGRQWELKYIAGKPAVVAMQKQMSNGRGTNEKNENNNNSLLNSDSWYRPLERFLLPWTRLRDGLYIDSNLVSAIQTFNTQTMQNKNGVFKLFQSDLFQTTVEGPFSWDGECQINNKSNKQQEEGSQQKAATLKKEKNAAICAFRPTKVTLKLGPWNIDQDIPGEAPFQQAPVRDLPFYTFIHVDDKVAIAMGRYGSIALWTRMKEESIR